MATGNKNWIILLQILAVLVDVTEGYTCSYVDTWGRFRYVYCSYGGCCGSYTNRYCCNNYSVGGVVGGVVGFVIFVAIVAGIISCCCCACCPGYRYRYRNNGTIITTRSTDPLFVQSGPNYSSTVTTASAGPPYSGQPAGAYTGQPAGAYTGQPAGGYKPQPPAYQA